MIHEYGHASGNEEICSISGGVDGSGARITGEARPRRCGGAL